MAIGNKNKGNDGSTLVIVTELSSKSKKNEEGKPIFSFSKKNEEGKYEVFLKADEYSGNLRSVKLGLRFDEDTPKGKELAKQYGNGPVVELTLIDPETNERYLCDFGFKGTTRSFFNSLLNLEDYDDLSISYWSDGKYDKLSLRQGGKLVKWKYSKDELPEVDKNFDKKGNQIKSPTDFDDLNTFLVEKLKEKFENLFKADESSQEEVPAPPTKGTSKVEEDEIPF